MFGRALLVVIVCGFPVRVDAQTPSPPPLTPEQASVYDKIEDLPPDTVLASWDESRLTAGELVRFLIAVPHLKVNFMRSPQEFIRQHFMLGRLARMSVEDKLEQRHPYKERVDFARTIALAQARIDEEAMQILVTAEDQKKYYSDNLDRYAKVTAKVIYIAYSSQPVASPDHQAPKPLTEAQAKAKAEDLVKQLRAGADFVKLVEERSDDAGTKAQKGDFGTPIGRTDNIPDGIKDALFARKKGEITDPVRQPNGYYIFRIEDRTTQPYDEVKDSIYQTLKQLRHEKWQKSLHDQVVAGVKFSASPVFGNAPAKAAAAPVKPN